MKRFMAVLALSTLSLTAFAANEKTNITCPSVEEDYVTVDLSKDFLNKYNGLIESLKNQGYTTTYAGRHCSEYNLREGAQFEVMFLMKHKVSLLRDVLGVGAGASLHIGGISQLTEDLVLGGPAYSLLSLGQASTRNQAIQASLQSPRAREIDEVVTIIRPKAAAQMARRQADSDLLGKKIIIAQDGSDEDAPFRFFGHFASTHERCEISGHYTLDQNDHSYRVNVIEAKNFSVPERLRGNTSLVYMASRSFYTNKITVDDTNQNPNSLIYKTTYFDQHTLQKVAPAVGDYLLSLEFSAELKPVNFKITVNGQVIDTCLITE